jgi:hypothetical protein
MLPGINHLLKAMSRRYHVLGAILKKVKKLLLTGNKRKPQPLILLCSQKAHRDNSEWEENWDV